jgi:hypothetical protein
VNNSSFDAPQVAGIRAASAVGALRAPFKTHETQ